jgi:hypothetical protein
MAGKAKEDEIEDDVVIVEEPEAVVDVGEIDSTEEVKKEKEPVVQKKTPVKKRGNDQQKRLNEIWLGRKQAEEEANRQAAIATQERAKNAQYEQITASALEENINTKRELLTERLANAKDQAEVAKITAELTKVEAQGAQIDRYKIENKIQPQKPQEQQKQERHQEPASPDEIYERMSPSGKKWLDENNDWYADDSENHDPEKSGDVKYYAQTLEQELVRSGRGAEIGTRSYFNKINDYIKQNWSDNMPEETDDEEEAPSVQQKKNYAAPVGNRNAQTPNPGSRKEYKISQSEKEMALALDMKDKMGNPLSDNDKIKRFINLRESVPSDGPISMKTMKKGV